MPTDHAKLSPSKGAQWIDCPGSVYAEPVVVESSNDASDTGTACHTVAESLGAKGKVSAKLWLGSEVPVRGRAKPIKLAKQHIGWIEQCLRWQQTYAKANPHSVIFREKEIEIGAAFGLPRGMCWGTADFVALGPTELCVADWKFGYNPVEVLGNVQLTLYAIGAEYEHGLGNIQTVRLVIIQPQVSDEPQEVVYSMEEINAWREEHALAVKLAADPTAPRRPSERACKWCKAAPMCPELHEQSVSLAKKEFASIETISVEQLADLLDKADMIKDLLRSAAVHAAKLLELGQKVPGYKLVKGKKHRVWSNEKQAIRALKKAGLDEDEIAPRKLCTPAQAEKVLGGKEGKELVSKLAETPEGEATLAREEDSRPALPPAFKES